MKTTIYTLLDDLFSVFPSVTKSTLKKFLKKELGVSTVDNMLNKYCYVRRISKQIVNKVPYLSIERPEGLDFASINCFDAIFAIQGQSDGEKISQEISAVRARFPYSYAYVDSTNGFLFLNYDLNGYNKIVAHNLNADFVVEDEMRNTSQTKLVIVAADGFANEPIENAEPKGSTIIIRLRRSQASVETTFSIVDRNYE
ncbi:MAG: hypothetical protein IJM28_02335 [Lachnospiraceae bacterium]|nr:hypothetical protein [Lachnospiraceae bacterium]